MLRIKTNFLVLPFKIENKIPPPKLEICAQIKGYLIIMWKERFLKKNKACFSEVIRDYQPVP